MATTTMKRGDAGARDWTVNADLTGATVTWVYRDRPDQPPLLTKTGTVVTSAAGASTVRVTFTTADTETTRHGVCEIRATGNDGSVFTFPSDTYERFIILPDLTAGVSTVPDVPPDVIDGGGP